MSRHNLREILKQKRHVLTHQSMNRRLIEMKNALRSQVYFRFAQHKVDMQNGIMKPFSKLTAVNLGDAQSFGQPPLTFLRQVLALCFWPTLMEDNELMFPEDVKDRADMILSEYPNRSVASLGPIGGLPLVRKHISQYIQNRDKGIPSNPENIFIHESYRTLDSLFGIMIDNRKKPVGMLIPIPNYPMYTLIAYEHSMQIIDYYLDEANWEVNVDELRRVVRQARNHCRPKGIVVINPGNPTGHVLTRENMQDIVQFCYQEQLILIADEVYQNSIYESEFISFKQVKHDMGEPFTELELASIHSASKGAIGECGFRGGYMELDGFSKKGISMFKDALSIHECSNPGAMVAVDVLAKPPQPSDPSFELYHHETSQILYESTQKTVLFAGRLNSIEGITVNPVQGGLFAYGAISNIPNRAINEARKQNMAPSVHWSMKLLDRTGIAVAPGAIFGEKPGTYHFRVTISPSMEVLVKVADEIKDFHHQFLQYYR